MSNSSHFTCPDCGNAQTNHTLKRLDSIISAVLDPLSVFGDKVLHMANPLTSRMLNRIGPMFLKGLARLSIGKIVVAPDQKTGARARCVWNEALRRGITMHEYRLFGISGEIFIATHGDDTIVFIGLPRPKGHAPRSISWIDNKGIMRKKFEAQGIPIAHGNIVFTLAKAKRIFRKLKKPVIIKPTAGSRSRHTTTHIADENELKIAFKKAKQLSISVIIEEELEGMVYRGTVIGGSVVGVLRREPPCVTADGIHTLRELIDIENERPQRHGPIFHRLEVKNPEHHVELLRQQLTLESVPEKGRVVLLDQKASRGIGGGATDVTDIAHEDNRALLENVARVLDESVVGIDFIISDITRSWKTEGRSGIIECNGMPFIDLHLFPLIGKVRDTPAALWDIVFPSSKK